MEQSSKVSQVVLRLYEAFNKRELDALDTVLAPDFYSHPLKIGREGVRESYTKILGIFPEAKAVNEAVIAEGDMVASRTRIEGVPSLPDGSQPIIMEMMKIRDGQIVELWGVTNMTR